MNKLPAFQFYPGDWRKDPGVQALSYHDRGVWFEILCLLHESENRGKLLLNGQAMPDDALARLLGLDKQVLTKALTTLLTYGVASRDSETGALMNRRMVRDEEIREIRRKVGKLGGNPNLVKQKDNQNPTTTDNQKSTPSSSSSISSSEEIVSAAEASPASVLFRNDGKEKTPRKSNRSDLTDEGFIASLKTNPAYGHINVESELGKMDAWLLVHPGRQKTRKFVVRWLNGVEATLSPKATPDRVSATPSSRRLPTPDEAAQQWLEENQLTQKNSQ